jgi:hypothetical protein
LKTVNKKKYIFIPLKDILDYYKLFSFVGQNWIVDIHKAFNNIIKHNSVSFKVTKLQTGGGNNRNVDPYTFYVPYISKCDEHFFKVHKTWYDLRVYRNMIKKMNKDLQRG